MNAPDPLPPPDERLRYFTDAPQTPDERAKLDRRRQRSRDLERFWLVMLAGVLGPALLLLTLAALYLKHFR